MKIIRYHNSPLYQPAANFVALSNEMDRLFYAALPDLASFQLAGTPGRIPVDLYEEKNNFVVRAELPGFRKEDLGIEVADGVLTITGQQKESSPESADKEKTASQERRTTRSLSLPENVAVDKIQAAYENGVLTVTLPRNEEVKPRQIAVEVK